MPEGNNGNPDCRGRSNCCTGNDSNLRDELMKELLAKTKKEAHSEASKSVQAEVNQKSKSVHTQEGQEKYQRA